MACENPADAPRHCNGDAHLCEQTIDAVTFAATHNAMSSEERGWLFPNQGDAIPTQLQKGIRGLNIDLYTNDIGELVFCHSYCEMGEQDMVDGFTEITDFLIEHPHEVLVLTFQSQVSAIEAATAMDEAGLGTLSYAHVAGEPWPTLGALIDAQTPVLSFTNSSDGAPDWLMDQWTHWVDTPYGQNSVEAVEDYATSCVEQRGNTDTATLFNINHFMTAPVARADHAAEINTIEHLQSRVDACSRLTGRTPNQILVDFADVGDVVEFVAHLNRQ